MKLNSISTYTAVLNTHEFQITYLAAEQKCFLVRFSESLILSSLMSLLCFIFRWGNDLSVRLFLIASPEIEVCVADIGNQFLVIN